MYRIVTVINHDPCLKLGCVPEVEGIRPEKSLNVMFMSVCESSSTKWLDLTFPYVRSQAENNKEEKRESWPSKVPEGAVVTPAVLPVAVAPVSQTPATPLTVVVAPVHR